MQYENVFKVIGVLHVILAFLKLFLLLKLLRSSSYTCLSQTIPAAQTAQKMAPGTGTGAPPVAQRLLTIATPKQVHIYTYMETRAKTKKQYNNT